MSWISNAAMSWISNAVCRVMAFLMITLLTGCAEDVFLDIPEFRRGGFLSQTNELDKKADAKRMEGVWAVLRGQEILGDSVAIMVSGDRITVYAKPNAGYIILESGHLDSVVFLQGYWRHQTTANTGLVNAYIPKQYGGGFILKGKDQPDTMQIIGTYGDGGGNPSKDIQLKWSRQFSTRAQQPYLVIAHRGGGRTADRIPRSENTVELIRMSERFGANAVELDVRLSSDGIPFLYHDTNLNPRLVQRGALVGPPENYPMRTLKEFVTLLQGETIPTLEEALHTIVHETNLLGVYLDTKTENVGITSKMVPLAQQAVLEAQSLSGRSPLVVLIGIPTQAVHDEFRRIPDHQLIPSLCELSLDQAIEIQSLVWSTRWTLGTQDNLIQRAHSGGMAVFAWTMDIDEFIAQYVNNSRFDGILTNYPSLVRYYVLMR